MPRKLKFTYERKERNKTGGGPAPTPISMAKENIINAMKDTSSFKGIDGGMETSVDLPSSVESILMRRLEQVDQRNEELTLSSATVYAILPVLVPVPAKKNRRTQQPPKPAVRLNKITNRIDPKVINLSPTKLDNSQIDLLIKGFKFTPTPIPNTTILKLDIQQFSSGLRLREYFGNGKSDNGSLVKGKSTFTPKSGRDEYLYSFIDTISKLPINYHNKKQNLSRREKIGRRIKE
ncbi:unnamed protein product [Mytilus edulis]|uniref:Uncharacterized protein n=1 Tax=Mytilus edulis TaxID=6550 RepID=A0A8S3SSG8_MYTED|nr:unnamed protein product [Mytilus edulis]